jgi:hypothetical protein
MALQACLRAAALLGAACNMPAVAGPALPWKLTVGEYVYANYHGTDVNLRWRADDASAWLGVYSDPVFGTQARTGADTSIALSDYVQLQPSVQAATLGFPAASRTRPWIYCTRAD